jgi:DNA-binding NtrC family response regulator
VEYGAFAYLTKPLSFEDLHASTERAIEQRRECSQAREALEEYRSHTRQRAARVVEADDETWAGEVEESSKAR